MSSIKFAKEMELPLIEGYDVAVIGGGPAGLGAAVTAADCGKKVILIERAGGPGGMAYIGEVSPFMHSHLEGVSLDRPVYTRWVEKMKGYQAAKSYEWLSNVGGKGAVETNIDKEYASLAAEDLLNEAGVRQLYFHALTDVVMKDGRNIDYLVLSARGGSSVALRAGMYIDATGDADLAALAGCEFEMGNEDGYCQPMTLCFKIGNVDPAISQSNDEFWSGEWRKLEHECYLKAQKEGLISSVRENLLIFRTGDPTVVHLNSTRVIKHDATNGESYSEAMVIARKQMREILTFLRRDVPPFANAQLLSVAQQIGVRESRRVKGIKYLTFKSFEIREKFADAIARCNYPIDIHNPSGTGTTMMHMTDKEFYEIPYGCIVPEDCDNLLMSGRPISVDHAVHSSMRIMPTACSIGQAAGMAAVMALNAKKKPSDLSGVDVRRKLAEYGAML